MISPEGCASILWKSAEKASEAAEALGITSGRLYELGLVDSVIPEPLGGAHRDVDVMAGTLKQSLLKNLDARAKKPTDDLIEARYKRLMSYGQFTDS